MADNVTIPATGTGTATPVVATDDVGGAHYQRVKLDAGGDGAATPILAGNGTAASSLRVTLASDSTGQVAITGSVTVSDGGGSLTVDNNGTFATQASGSVAHDSADSGNPVKVGAKATSALSGITLVASGDRTDLYAGVDGVLIIRPNADLEDIVRGTAAITDGSSTSVIASSGAGVKTYVTDVIIANSSASNVTVDIRDGTAGSVIATFPVPANGGVVHRFGSPLAGSAATAVAADPSASASTITVTLVGFKSKV